MLVLRRKVDDNGLGYSARYHPVNGVGLILEIDENRTTGNAPLLSMGLTTSFGEDRKQKANPPMPAATESSARSLLLKFCSGQSWGRPTNH